MELHAKAFHAPLSEHGHKEVAILDHVAAAASIRDAECVEHPLIVKCGRAIGGDGNLAKLFAVMPPWVATLSFYPPLLPRHGIERSLPTSESRKI